nr:hypothetical protein BHI3_14620 [Bacteriovorax sp. HI3]
MKHLLLASALLLSLNVAHAKKAPKKAKLSKEDAKELCLTTKGAELSKKELKKCIAKAMRTGKA